ncbi:MAG TPA: ring-cleaving dioxygenase [Anaerolineae bacterium]
MKLNGLHHVTAVTAKAQANYNFYTQVLGMRLVKKTVNQDDVSAYHLFYADKLGSPGTNLTFFDWAIGPNRNGPGSIANTGLRVPGRAALDWWAERLTHQGLEHSGLVEFHGHSLINFTDPEGQHLSLVNDDGAPGGTPWEKSLVPAEHAIRGLYASTLIVRELELTELVLTKVMGYERAADYETGPNERMIVYELDGGGAGNEIWVVEQPDGSPGQLGAGGVHHIAFRVPDDEAQRAWRERLASVGLGVTDIIDRFYFHSIYFRIPGGILFEIATDGPGFTADEDLDTLGEQLALPPFLEPQRARIEAGLKPIATMAQ